MVFYALDNGKPGDIAIDDVNLVNGTCTQRGILFLILLYLFNIFFFISMYIIPFTS